jgi:hypothetical protein
MTDVLVPSRSTSERAAGVTSPPATKAAIRCRLWPICDAAHIRSEHHAGSTWGAKGDTPIVQATGARHGMTLISAVTSRGHMRFMVIDKGIVNADVFIEFLEHLTKVAEMREMPKARANLASCERDGT